MEKKIYQTPKVITLKVQQEGILCGSDTTSAGTGAKWEIEDGSDVEFNH